MSEHLSKLEKRALALDELDRRLTARKSDFRTHLRALSEQELLEIVEEGVER